MNFSIIIPLYNTVVYETPCFEYLGKRPNDQFIFVDNSDDQFSSTKNQHALSQIKNTVYINNGKNLGLPKAYNEGLKRTTSDWIIFFDQDTPINPNYFSISEQEILANKNFMIFAPTIKANGKIISPISFNGFRSRVYPQKVKKGFLIPINSGAIVNKEVFIKVAHFDEELFLDCVDYSFFYECAKKGYPLFHIQDLVLLQSFSGLDFNSSVTSKKRRYKILLHDLYHFYSKNGIGKKYARRLALKRAVNLSVHYKTLSFVIIFLKRRKFISQNPENGKNT